MTTPDARKLLLGSLLIGASSAPPGGILTGVLTGVGGNWLSEALGSVISAGPPPDAALRAAFTRAVQRAATDLRQAYGRDRVAHDGHDAFDLVRQTARRMTDVTLPPGVADLRAIQQALGGALTSVLHGFPDAQTTLLRDRLLTATAQAFHAARMGRCASADPLPVERGSTGAGGDAR
jgi:hypothetical protein